MRPSSRGAGARGLGRDGTYDRRSLVGSDDARAQQALAILRTFRMKLQNGIDKIGAADRVGLTVEDRNVGGEVGGDTLVITPANLGLVNWALGRGQEAPIALEPEPPSEFSDVRRAHSLEDAGQLLARTNHAHDRLVREVA